MFSDPVLIGGIVIGLAMGSFGYVLFRFVWRPTRQYRHLKKQISRHVISGCRDNLTTAQRDRLRRLSVALHELTTTELPHWYQLAVKRRGETPEEAVRQLQGLVNCRDRQALQKRCQAVCESLKIRGHPQREQQ